VLLPDDVSHLPQHVGWKSYVYILYDLYVQVVCFLIVKFIFMFGPYIYINDFST